MRIRNYCIRDVMKGIDGRKMILPAFQREFVWRRKDIERLFDSLLQGFPINTLMFWEVDDIMNGVMEYYEFLSSKFQESVSTNSIYQVRDNDSKIIVVDGQQRLTSLWISLYGSYTLEKGCSYNFKTTFNPGYPIEFTAEVTGWNDFSEVTIP